VQRVKCQILKHLFVVLNAVFQCLAEAKKPSIVALATLQPVVYKVDKYPFLSVGQDALR
jgi:hypothetical protein